MLREDVPEHVVHTASSALLLREPYMMHYYGFFVEQMFPASAKLAEALEKYQNSTAATDTAFGLAMNTNETLFKYLENRPELMARFVGAMEGVNRDPSQSQKHVITGYPWAELGDATVVDVSIRYHDDPFGELTYTFPGRRLVWLHERGACQELSPTKICG